MVARMAAKDSGKRARKPATEDAKAAARLPAGRHGLPREFITQNQRERIITALVDTVAERGYNATTVADITKAASVSRRTFYEHFSGKEDCFLAAYEMVSDHLRGAMQEASESETEWPRQVRASLATMLGFLASEPELARVCMIEPVAAGGEIASRHRATMASFVAILKSGRPQRRGERPLPDATEETLVGGIISLLVREISAGRSKGLEALLPDLVELTLAPYLGPDEAASLREPAS